MIRILQCVNIMDRAGLETMLMNYYRHIDKSKIQFDFLTHRPDKGDYDDEIISMGGKIYRAPRLYPQNYFSYFKWMKKFFLEHPEYKIIHSHIDAMSYLPLLAAKHANIPIRIAHSHNTAIDKDFKFLLKQLFRIRINTVCNFRFSCGEKAGEFLFGSKEFSIIPNAIETGSFNYSENLRIIKRKELNIEDKYVVGHVGRFSYQKNHQFLIKVFAEIVKLKKNSILLLIGVGEKEDEIKKLVKELDINENVIFLGSRSDVNELYQAMDIFLMPSFFEGIPVVGIEAQFSNLPCIFSDGVPLETKFSKNVKFLSLSDSYEKWATESINVNKEKKDRSEKNIESQKYNIDYSYSILENLYLHLYEIQGLLVKEGENYESSN